MQVLIDTNVIIDALMMRGQWAVAAQELLRSAAMGEFAGCVLASQTTDIFYIIRRQGVDTDTAKSIIKRLTTGVKVLDVTSTDVDNALISEMADYEDAILAFCAYRHKAEYIITRNEKDFNNSPVPALSPQAFIER